MSSAAELDQMIKSGELIESTNEMTPEYLRELKHTLIVSGDTELISAPAYYLAAKRAPSINAFMTGIAIIQDELAHAHIAYHIHDKCSYGPWKRGLNKVMLEENFHLRNGRTWMKRIAAAGGAARDELQRAVDWMFPLSVEWFGLPDSKKMHSLQLDYRLKGLTNDQLRQWWLSQVVPYCEQIGVKVPAHKDTRDGKDVWELDYPFPCEFDAENKRWDFKQPISWDDVLLRWRARGPRNAEMVAMFQQEFHNFRKAHHQES